MREKTGGYFSFEQDLVGKCAQVIIQAISYFIPKQSLMKSLGWLEVSEIRSEVFTADAVKNTSGLWGGRREFRNPPLCNGPVWFSCRHRQGRCYQHGMSVQSVFSKKQWKWSCSRGELRGSDTRHGQSVEERQENRFYYFGVVYFLLFLFFPLKRRILLSFFSNRSWWGFPKHLFLLASVWRAG